MLPKAFSTDIDNFIVGKYKEEFSFCSIVRMLRDKNITMSEEKVKKILLSKGIKLREKGYMGKKYQRGGRFAHII